jgi:glycerophosphoryl diester phosphodiesterase
VSCLLPSGSFAALDAFRVLAFLTLALIQVGATRVRAQIASKTVRAKASDGRQEKTETGRPIVIAHRGASGYLPEHTLAAYAYAHAVGADYIEQDVVLTRDEVPIVLHDVHLDAVTNVRHVFPDRVRDDGFFYAIDFTLDEIKQLRVRERTKRDGSQRVYPERFPHASCDFRIPTLSEAIDLVQGLNRSTGRCTGIYPEIKRPGWHRQQGFDISRIVVKLLASCGYQELSDPCIVQCFEANETRRMRNELGCGLRLVQLISDSGEALTIEALGELSEFANGVGPALELIVKSDSAGQYSITNLTDQCHRVGLVVHPYTLRADALPSYASSFTSLVKTLEQEAKVDGFFTDFPDQALNALKSTALETSR